MTRKEAKELLPIIQAWTEGKEIQFKSRSGRFGKAVTLSDHFSKFGLNINDYDNLKWEDEPVEVFVNKET